MMKTFKSIFLVIILAVTTSNMYGAAAPRGVEFREIRQHESEVEEEGAYGRIYIKKRHGSVGSNFAHLGDQHTRGSMEDAHKEAISERYDFFAVYDGHGGKEAAEFAAQHLHHFLARLLNEGVHPRRAIVQASEETSANFIREPGNDRSGTTAIIVLIDKQENQLYLANLADARAVLCANGNVVAATVDHNLKTSDTDTPEEQRITEQEIARIRRHGGGLDLEAGRLYGERHSTNVTRAIGDAEYHKYGLISEPDVYPNPKSLHDDGEYDITAGGAYRIPENGILILACDGVWDAGITNEAACTFVTEWINAGDSNLKVSSGLVRLAKRKSEDNISVTIVDLRPYLAATPIQPMPAPASVPTEIEPGQKVPQEIYDAAPKGGQFQIGDLVVIKRSEGFSYGNILEGLRANYYTVGVGGGRSKTMIPADEIGRIRQHP